MFQFAPIIHDEFQHRPLSVAFRGAACFSRITNIFNTINLGHASTGVSPGIYFTNNSPTVLVTEGESPPNTP